MLFKNVFIYRAYQIKFILYLFLLCFTSSALAIAKGFVDGPFVSNPSRYSYRSHVLFKSSDPITPDYPKKIVLSKDFNYLFFLGSKGVYTTDLKKNSTTLDENKLVVLKGTNATGGLSPSFTLDSSKSISLGSDNKLARLQKVFQTFGSFQTRVNILNLGFPIDDFIALNYRGFQANNFDILNILTGNDGYFYVTAINDKFQTFTESQSFINVGSKFIGGSDVNGSIEIPTIYKFRDGKKIDGSAYFSSSTSPKILKIGSGKCVFVDSNGDYFTIESDRILKWSPNNNKPIIVAGGNGKGSALNQLNLNTDTHKPIDIDKDGNIYINDYYNQRVVLWKKDATIGEVIISDKLNNISNFYPNSIALDESKNLIISDSGVNSQVLKFFNCNYLIKSSIQRTATNELSTLSQGNISWYLNGQLISGVNSINFKPKTSGYYKVQSDDINGCKSFPSDSIYYDCTPAKPEIEISGKTELKVNIPNDEKLYSNFNTSISNYGLVKFENLSKNYSSNTWYFPDGTTSIEKNPSKYFNLSGKYVVKLEVKNSKGESSLIQNIVDIVFPSRPNIVYTDLGNRTYLFKSLEKEGVISWDFGDGFNSNVSSPTHTFLNQGSYNIKLNLQGLGYKRVVTIQVNTANSIDLVNGNVVDLPIYNAQSIFNDISGYQNNANFNGKINYLTNQGVFPTYSFSSIKLAGCNPANINERIQIPNYQTINDLDEITFSGWFGLDPSLSMFPGDGSCRPNGRQVLFSKGGDGYGTSPPGFNCMIDITDKKLSLIIEFSKKSGDFAYNRPISDLLDTVKVEEKYEFVYKGDIVALPGILFPSTQITKSPRLGTKESPFQHFIISFSKTRIKVFINGRKIIDDSRSISFDEINLQDIYIGAMGPKSTAVNSIANWYPFKGRIDRIKVFNRVLSDSEANALYLEKNSNE